MKITLVLALAAAGVFLAPANAVHAAPKAKAGMESKMSKMFESKENRMMAIKELMSNKERKMELVKMLKADPEFREMFGNATTGGG